MKALSQKEISKIYDSYKLHGSLRAVSKLYVRSVNTVKKYVSKYMEVKSQNIVKKLATNDERLIGLYVGLWLGDGTQYIENHSDGFVRYTTKICCHKQNILLNRFIQNMIFKLFNKNTNLYNEPKNNRAVVKFYSKFIYNFIFEYIEKDSGKKTHSVRLKNDTSFYSKKFLEGCLLGLALSDGYLKNNFMFNVTSKKLSNNMKEILFNYDFRPYYYKHIRKKYGWKDLHMLKLNVAETRKLNNNFNSILRKLGCTFSFKELKYGPSQI